jgi:hypothetical protein
LTPIIRERLIQRFHDFKDDILDLHCANHMNENEITKLNIELNKALEYLEVLGKEEL